LLAKIQATFYLRKSSLEKTRAYRRKRREISNFKVQFGNMRLLFTLLASIAFLAPKAQGHLPVGGGLGAGWGFAPWQPYVPYSLILDSDSSHRWQMRPYASLSAGYMFLGGGVSYLSAPVGVIFYKPLNDNFTTFAGASVAPTVFNFSRLYAQQVPGNNFTGLSVNPSVQGGLIYTNDAKTFSISGSISVERGSYPVYAPSRPTATKQY
jgi:hypothetical protein